MQKWGGLGWLGAHKVNGNVNIRQSAYDFLFDFNRNYVSIFYHFRDITSYLSKVADFDPPHLHLAPPQGVTPVVFRGDLWHQKTRVPGVSWGCCLCDPTFCRFSGTPACDERTQTDRRTDRYRAMASTADAQHRAVKIGEDRTCSSEDMIVDRQTHTHRQTCSSQYSAIPYRVGVNITNLNITLKAYSSRSQVQAS